MNKKQIFRCQPLTLLLFRRLNFTTQKNVLSLDKRNIASDDIAKILPPNRSNNVVVKLHWLKNAFRPVGEAAIEFDLKKCCIAKGQRFRYLNENRFKTYSRLV